MDDQATPAIATSSGLTPRPRPSAGGATGVAPLWHLGWAVGAAAAGAGLEAILGAISWPTLLALGCAIAAGLLGYFWRPEASGRRRLLVVWAAAMVAAVWAEGGPAGPLGPWCVMPLLAGALLGTSVEGAMLAGAALAVGLGLQFGGAVLPAPRGLFGLGVSILGLLTAGGASATAVLILDRRGPQGDGAAAAGVEAGELAALRSRLNDHEAAAAAREQRLAEAERARDAALAARDDAESNAAGRARFLANMSHELRTPLNAIMGFSDIMRARMFGDLPPRYAEYAQLIHESGRHLTDLINDVLDMSKIEADRYSLSREVFDAREAVNAALRLVRLQADDAGVTLRGLSPPEPLMVDADRRALKQIVLNLVSNALKFTPRGGSVTVSTQPARGELELTVADTGVGIAKDDLERLGRPFEQAGDAESKVQGTGLGLSLVKAFAGLHGGTMSIESELGEGVAVTVRLPVLAGAPAGSVAADPAAGAAASDEGPPETSAALPAPPEPPAGENRPRMGEVIPLNIVR